MKTALFVGLGGAIGSVARHAVNIWMMRAVPHLAIPYATFVVNVVGCFVIGALSGLIASQRLTMTTETRAFVFVGVLGGFTTFSTFGLDTFVLMHAGARGAAAWNVGGQVAVGLLAVYTGFFLGRR